MPCSSPLSNHWQNMGLSSQPRALKQLCSYQLQDCNMRRLSKWECYSGVKKESRQTLLEFRIALHQLTLARKDISSLWCDLICGKKSFALSPELKWLLVLMLANPPTTTTTAFPSPSRSIRSQVFVPTVKQLWFMSHYLIIWLVWISLPETDYIFMNSWNWMPYSVNLSKRQLNQMATADLPWNKEKTSHADLLSIPTASAPCLWSRSGLLSRYFPTSPLWTARPIHFLPKSCLFYCFHSLLKLPRNTLEAKSKFLLFK